MPSNNLEPAILLGAARADLLREESLASLFMEASVAWSEKIACCFGDDEYSYKQLNDWSNHIAALLQSKGIGRGDFVGVW